MAQIFKIGYANGRRRALAAVTEAPEGYEVIVQPPNKTREQEERYHAMIGDIAKQCMHLNEKVDAETWKRLLVDQFRRETMRDPDIGDYWVGKGVRMIPSLDGSGVVVLGEQTRRFPKYVASAFVEWLFAFGAEQDVEWSDPSKPPIEAYATVR